MHTNSTPNFNLPQFIASDTPAWLTDVNQAMSAIDTAMQANKAAAADAATTAAGASSKADTASSNAAAATTVANNAATTANAANVNAQNANQAVENIKNNWQSSTVEIVLSSGTTNTNSKISVNYNATLKMLQIGGYVFSINATYPLTISFLLPDFVPAPPANCELYNSVCVQNNGSNKGQTEISDIIIQTNKNCNFSLYTASQSGIGRDHYISWSGMYPFINTINS